MSKRKRRKAGQRRPPPPQRSATRSPAGRRSVEARRAAAEDERPPAPWGSFPLIEIAVFVGIVLLVLGFFVVKGTQGGVMIGVGVALASLGGLELSVREHFAGYRSHSLLLAGVLAAIVLAGLFYLAPALPVAARLLLGALIFAGAAWMLSRQFERRVGVAYKLR